MSKSYTTQNELLLNNLLQFYDYTGSYHLWVTVPYNKDLSKTTSVFQKWGDQIIEKGIPDNNWNLFQARFLTYLALVLEGNDSYRNKKPEVLDATPGFKKTMQNSQVSSLDKSSKKQQLQ